MLKSAADPKRWKSLRWVVLGKAVRYLLPVLGLLGAFSLA
jgi:hypothetical protein